MAPLFVANNILWCSHTSHIWFYPKELGLLLRRSWCPCLPRVLPSHGIKCRICWWSIVSLFKFWDIYSIEYIRIPFLRPYWWLHWQFLPYSRDVPLIGSVLSHSIWDIWILIMVWPSLNYIHSLAFDGVMYFTMVFMCTLPDLFPVKVVLFWLGTNGAAVSIRYFLPCLSIWCPQCCPTVILLVP